MKALTILLSLAFLASCDKANEISAGVIGDDIARQTSAFQRATQARDWTAIANEPVVDCAKEPVACGRLHAMHGDACLNLAMAARSNPIIACPPPEPAVTARLTCADRDFSAAAGLLSGAERAGAKAGRANALFCRAEGLSTVAGVPAAAEAEREGGEAGSPAGLLWAARSAAYQAQANAGSATQRCGALRRANDLVRRGGAMGDAVTRPGYDAMRAEIARMRASIPSCTL